MISQELSEARAKARVKKEPGHEPVFHWEANNYRTYRFNLNCSCGIELRATSYATRTGAVSAWDIKEFNHHVNQVRNTWAEPTEPLLIGKVLKQRVTNEVWVFNRTGDKPEPHARQNYDLEWWYVWNVLLKNTAGWAVVSGGNTRELAIQKACSYLDRKALYHEIQYVYENEVGVEAPVATIVNSVARLVERANNTKDNPVKLSELLKDLDEGVTQLQILVPLRDSAQERLSKSLDLGI